MKGLSVARDGRIACLAGSRERTDEVALLAPDGHRLALVTNESSWLAGRTIATSEELWLPTRHPGQPWQAWVTHQFVLQDLAGVGTASGEALVLRAAGDAVQVQVLGRWVTA